MFTTLSFLLQTPSNTQINCWMSTLHNYYSFHIIKLYKFNVDNDENSFIVPTDALNNIKPKL
jgi:hypothetical protein